MPGPVQHIDLEDTPGAWRLTRADPAPDIAGVVLEYWEVAGALRPFRETLLPNGCAEVMVNLGPPHRLLGTSEATTWEHSWYSGLHERSLTIESAHGTHLVSARLHPLGAVALLGRRTARLANSVVELESLLGDGARSLREALLDAETPEARFDLLEVRLRVLRQTGYDPPTFLRAAATRIEHEHGNLRVASLHEELGVSRKHLAVSFTQHLGMSAKAYANIQRFVWTIRRLRECTTVDWAKLANEAGYSDQSHLARDFRRIGAASPTEYLRRWTPDGSALLYEHG